MASPTNTDGPVFVHPTRVTQANAIAKEWRIGGQTFLRVRLSELKLLFEGRRATTSNHGKFDPIRRTDECAKALTK